MGIRIRSALAGLAVLAVTACGSGGTPSQDERDNDMGATATPAESAAPTGDDTTSADPGDTASADTAEPADTASASPSSSDDSGATAQDADLADVDFNTDAQAAIDKSTDEVGDGIVHAIEIEWDDEDYNAWVWSVKTLVDTTDHKVKINADTGEILKQESDDTDDKEEAIDLTSPMTPQDAMQKALDKQDGAIRSWKLEFDDGRREYQFDIGEMDNTTEVTVDVESGDVTLD